MKQTNLKTKEELQEIERSTIDTFSLMKRILPNYRKLAEACDVYWKAQLGMNKATDILFNAIEALSDTSLIEGGQQIHPDLNVGVKNTASVLRVWKDNLMKVSDEFRAATTTIKGDVTTFPKEIENKEKEYKALKAKENDEIKRVNKELEKISKNTKLQQRNMNALPEALKNVTQREADYQKFLMDWLKEALQMYRGTYGQLFECFRRVFLTKSETDTQSQSIIDATMNDMNKLIKNSKNFPAKFRQLVTLKKQSSINQTWLSPELKGILKDAGIKPKDLANPEVVDMLIEVVKQAVDQGLVEQDLLDQLNASRSNKEDKVADVIEADDFVAPKQPPSKKPPAGAPKSSSSSSSSKKKKHHDKSSSHAPAAAASDAPAPPPPPAAPSLDFAPPPPPPSLNLPPPPPPPAGGLPPPPPPTGGMPPPPPASGGLLADIRGGVTLKSAPPPAPAGGNLLADIRSGITLKSAAERKQNDPVKAPDSGKQDLTSMLRKAMEVRRNDIADDSDDDDSDDDDEWSD